MLRGPCVGPFGTSKAYLLHTVPHPYWINALHCTNAQKHGHPCMPICKHMGQAVGVWHEAMLGTCPQVASPCQWPRPITPQVPGSHLLVGLLPLAVACGYIAIACSSVRNGKSSDGVWHSSGRGQLQDARGGSPCLMRFRIGFCDGRGFNRHASANLLTLAPLV